MRALSIYTRLTKSLFFRYTYPSSYGPESVCRLSFLECRVHSRSSNLSGPPFSNPRPGFLSGAQSLKGGRVKITKIQSKLRGKKGPLTVHLKLVGETSEEKSLLGQMVQALLNGSSCPDSSQSQVSRLSLTVGNWSYMTNPSKEA